MGQYLDSKREVPDCNGFLLLSGWSCLIETPFDTQHSIQCCEACYQNHVVGSPAEASFTGLPRPTTLELRPCQFSIPLIRRAFDKAAGQAQPDRSESAYDWGDFARDVYNRMSLKPCTEGGKPKPQFFAKWYHVLGTAGDVAVCETCYLDHAALTRFENRFVKIERDRQQEQHDPASESLQDFMSRLRRDARVDRPCAMSLPAGRAAWEATLNTGNFVIFSRAATALFLGTRCQENGVMPVGGEAYYLTGADPIINFCPSCYTGYFAACGMGIYLGSIAPKQGERLPPCALHPSSRDAAEYAIKIQQAVDEGVLTCFNDFVTERARFVRPCPRDEMVQNRSWYGFLDLTICPRCYESEVVGSTLENSIIFRGNVIPAPTMCCLYSPRMRSLWQTACQEGNPQTIRAISRERTQMREYVVTNTARCWDRINARNLIGAMQGMTSSIYSFADGLNAPHGGRQYGSSSLGWHDSRLGAQSAALSQQMSSTLSSGNFDFDFQMIQKLEMMWREVE